MEPGYKSGRLEVIRLYEIKNHRRYWLCKCECGKETVVRQDCLTMKTTKSCGCLEKEWQHSHEHPGKKTHGMKKTRLYRIWQGMKGRCYTKSASGYKDYGGRGITVCDDWKNDFMNFYNWAIDNGYNDGLSIDRKDVNGNYEPDNCRWANNSTQRKNQRQILLTYKGETKTLLEWSEKTGIGYCTLNYRFRSGWDAEKILETPAIPGRNQNSK